MSIITLSEAKAYLDVIHSSDDAKLQALLDSAEHEALDFMNRKDFEEFSEGDYYSDDINASDAATEYSTYGMPSTVRTAILFILEASYQATPEHGEKLVEAARMKLWPHRVCLGV